MRMDGTSGRSGGAVPPARRGAFRLDVYLLKKGIRLEGNRQVLHGLRVPPAAIAAVEGAIDGAETVFISFRVSFHVLEELVRNPELVAQRFYRVNGRLEILTPEELCGRIEAAIKSAPLQGLKELLARRTVLPKKEVIAILKNNLAGISSVFAEEKVNDNELTLLLYLMAEAGCQELDRAFVAELQNAEKYDQAVAVAAISFFEYKYAKDPFYHETQGDLAVRYEVHDVAAKAYQQALEAAPKNSALQKKQKSAARAAKKEREERSEAFRREALDLWKKLPDKAAAQCLLRLISRRLDEFDSMLGNISSAYHRNEYQSFVNFEFLEDNCTTKELAELAPYFRRLQNDLISDIFARVAKGNAITPARMMVVNKVLERGGIERLDPALADKLVIGADSSGHRHQELCRFILLGAFYKPFEEAQKLFREGNLDEAIEKLRLCHAVLPKEEQARRNLAIMLTTKADKLFREDKIDAAEAIFKEALGVDPICLPALERMAIIKLNQGRYDEAREYAQAGIDAQPPMETPKQQENARRARHAAYGNLGLIHLLLYLQQGHKPEDLGKAHAALLEAVRRDPEEVNHQLNLAKVRLLLGEIHEAGTWLVRYLDGGKAEPMKVLDFAGVMWEAMSGPGELMKNDELNRAVLFIARYLKETIKVSEELQGELITLVLEFALNLQHLGQPELGDEIVAAARTYGDKKTGGYHYALCVQARKEAVRGDYEAALARLVEVIDSDVTLRVYEEDTGSFQSLKIYAAELLLALFNEIAGTKKDPAEKRKLYRNGIKIIGRVVKEFPDSPVLHCAVGMFYEGMKELDRAQAEYQAAIDLDRSYLVAQISLANVLQARGKKEEAREVIVRMKEAAGKCMEAARTDFKQFDRFRMLFLHKSLVMFYAETKIPELLDILRQIVGNEFGIDMVPGIKRAVEEAAEDGKDVPPEILALISART